MKIVINACYGGFSISKECAEYMAKKGHKQAQAELDKYNKKNDEIKYFLKNGKWRTSDQDNKFLEISVKYTGKADWNGYGYVDGFENGYKRDDQLLVEAVEHLKEKANGAHSELKVVEIPDDVDWSIGEYDGFEHVEEKHRTWS